MVYVPAESYVFVVVFENDGSKLELSLPNSKILPSPKTQEIESNLPTEIVDVFTRVNELPFKHWESAFTVKSTEGVGLTLMVLSVVSKQPLSDLDISRIL